MKCAECDKNFIENPQANGTRKYCNLKCREKANSKRNRPHRSKRKEELQNLILQSKLNNPCACGETNPVCLVHHHRDPQIKSFGISRGLNKLVSKSVLIHELEKCDVLCSNCHLKYHSKKKAEIYLSRELIIKEHRKEIRKRQFEPLTVLKQMPQA